MPDDIDDAIQFNLFQDLDNLSNWFRRNEINLQSKEGKICGKRMNLLQGHQFKLLVNGTMRLGQFSENFENTREKCS